MNERQIKQIVRERSIPSPSGVIDLVETHISWLLLTDQFAYKIKKPVKFSFLDFSTLKKRQYFCQRELQLNRRLTQGIYLEVLPIRSDHDKIRIGSTRGVIIDYCVKMKRMDNSREMKRLLQRDRLALPAINSIALLLSGFHQRTEVIRGKVRAEKLQEDFADLRSVSDLMTEQVDAGTEQLFDRAIAYSHNFLVQFGDRIRWRDENGFTRDCHGDLHSGNIFILAEPVIFDCIEFSDHLRQIDILNELAFFCMDLEYYRKPAYSEHFLSTYLRSFPVILNGDDLQIFHYYKLYRANIKIKVNAIKARQMQGKPAFKDRLRSLRRYYDLLQEYLTAGDTLTNR